MAVLTQQPARLDLGLYAGDAFSLRLEFRDQATGDPWPLAETWTAQIRDSCDEIRETFAVDTSDAAGGNLVLSLTAAQTANLRGLSGLVYDLEDGTRTWYRGNVGAAKDVTRP